MTKNVTVFVVVHSSGEENRSRVSIHRHARTYESIAFRRDRILTPFQTARFRSLGHSLFVASLAAESIAGKDMVSVQSGWASNAPDESLDMSDLNRSGCQHSHSRLTGLSGNLSRFLRVTLSVDFRDISCRVTENHLGRFKSKLLPDFRSTGMS